MDIEARKQPWLYQALLGLLVCMQSVPLVTSQQPSAMLCTSPMAQSNRIILRNILEDWPVGTTLVHLDIYGTDDEINLQLAETNEYLTFDPVSRNLTLVKPFNCSRSPSPELTLLCNINHTSVQLAIPLLVLLLDVNDNAPVFGSSEYMATVSEMVPVNTTVIKAIQASDADPRNRYILYSVVEEEYSTYFNFPSPATGDLVLRRPLDYETMGSFSFRIRATDYHPTVLNKVQPQLNSTAVVTITLTDGDDQNPAFGSSVYYATVEELAPIMSKVIVTPNITAFDQDTQVAARIVYSLVTDDVNGDSAFFNIDSSTAEITVANNAFERGRVYTLLIRATQADNPDRYATSILRINIQAANESPPRFLQTLYPATLVENTPVGTPVVTVSAIDNDEGTILTYRLAGTVEDFAIDGRKGSITTAKPLDYETTPSYNLTVEASDGKFTARTVVSISIVDINDNRPVFDEKVYTFDSYREENYVVGTVRAVDIDRGSVIQYSFVEETDLFQIYPNGEIRVSKTDLPDSQYKLFVVANDNGLPQQQGSAVVVVRFDPITEPLVGDSDNGETDLVIIIVLAVLAGVLLIIIIIMLIYIYKKVTTQALDDATLLSFISHRLRPSNRRDKVPHCVRSQSFERASGLKPDYRAYLETPEGSTFKPTARHLQLYDDIRLDEDATTTQENPFRDEGGETSTDPHASAGPGYTYVYAEPHRDRNRDRNRRQTPSRRDVHSDESLSYPPTSSSTLTGKPMNSTSDFSVNKQMGEINEVVYETAIAPMETDPRPQTDHLDSSFLGSSSSSIQSNSQFSTFKVSDSTQHLVAPPVPIRKGSSVTFEDEPGLYGSQNPASSNSSSVRVNNSNDKITVYY